MPNLIKYLFELEVNFKKYSRDKFFQKQFDVASNLYSKNLKAHLSCVNAIEFSNSYEYMASAGDDKRVLIWNLNDDIFSKETIKKTGLNTLHNSNIFTIAWDNEDKKIFSGGNDHQLIVHDVETREICDIFLHENAVNCITVHPQQSQIFATACESGQISLYDLRLSNIDPIILASSECNISQSYTNSYISSDSSSNSSYSSSHSIPTRGGAFLSCHFNPINGNLIAVANEISGISLIDIRMNSSILTYRSHIIPEYQTDKRSSTNQNVMSVRFNRYGTHFAALRNSLQPVIYEVNNVSPICMFDSDDFKNSCTLKSSCFAGNLDQYLISGSDDSSVFCWKIPTKEALSESITTLVDKPHLKLEGHHSIVNQCRYNYKYHLLATSGIEKIIKIWSTYSLPIDISEHKNKLDSEFESFNFSRITSSPASNTNYDNGIESSNLIEDSFENQINSLIDESIEEGKTTAELSDSQLKDSKNENRRKNGTDIKNETSDSSSSSYDSDFSDSMSADESIEEQFIKSQQQNRKSVKPFSKKLTKRKLIPLRDRIRNLRHRRTLNITEQSDFKKVVDSLYTESNQDDTKEEKASKFFYEKSNFAKSNEKQYDIIDYDSTNKPCTSISLTRKLSLKSLNEQKRRIEMNNDSDHDAERKKIKDANDSSEKIFFKKFKRKNNELKKGFSEEEESK